MVGWYDSVPGVCTCICVYTYYYYIVTASGGVYMYYCTCVCTSFHFVAILSMVALPVHTHTHTHTRIIISTGGSTATCSSSVGRETGGWRDWMQPPDWVYGRRRRVWRHSWQGSLRCSRDSVNCAPFWERAPYRESHSQLLLLD